jgi:hypothetical protein
VRSNTLQRFTGPRLVILALLSCLFLSLVPNVAPAGATGSTALNWTFSAGPQSNQYEWAAVTSAGTSTVPVFFVAVGAMGDVGYSTDGLTWTVSTSPAGQSGKQWVSVTSGGGLVMAVAADGTVITSSDGQNWSLGASLSSSINGLTYATYGGFVAVAQNGYTYASATGASWTTNAQEPANFAATAASSKGVVAVGTNTAYYSTNGLAWTQETMPSGQWNSVTAGPNGSFVAVSAGGQTATSVDGQTWTTSTQVPATFISSVAFGNSTTVAVNTYSPSSSAFSSSDDGATWTAGTSPSSGLANDDWSSVAYGDGLFVAVSLQGDSMVTGTVLNVPNAPTVSSIYPIPTDYLAVALTPSASQGGSPILDYVVGAVDPFGNVTLCIAGAVSNPACLLHGIKPQVTYTITAIAVNAQGNSVESAPRYFNAQPFQIVNYGQGSLTCFPGFAPNTLVTLALEYNGLLEELGSWTSNANGQVCVTTKWEDPSVSIDGGRWISVPAGAFVSIVATGTAPNGGPITVTQSYQVPGALLASTGVNLVGLFAMAGGLASLGALVITRRRRAVAKD